MKNRISVIIPCYNSEKTLVELVKQIISVLNNNLLEIILINDASQDNTWFVIQEIVKSQNRVKGINLMKNFGQHSALLCGLNYADGGIVVTMDDDLQNPPEEIIKLINLLESDDTIDAVIGIPKKAKQSFFKRLGSSFLNHAISKILNKPKDLKVSSFRALRRNLVDEMKTNQTTNPAFSSLLLNYTRNVKNVVVQHNKRQFGNSGYGIGKSVKLFLNAVLNYSTLPLKIVSNIGIISSVAGFGLAIFYLIKYFIGNITVPGWTTIIVLLLFFFGLILFSLGIIGEYLIRIIREVNHTRQYVIKDKVGFNDE
jgi:glycosyltransferase involved in cell wall biosynthesis